MVTHRSFATIVSQLKICDFSGEIFKGFEVGTTTTQLLSSGEFCKLRYDTIRFANCVMTLYVLQTAL
jgi:hypothetical protein